MMMQILEHKMITLPLVRTFDHNKPLPQKFKPNAYCHFHQQNEHDTKHCESLKHIVQDLIDLGQIFIKGGNDQGNKSMDPPNQNLKIFTNPLLNHNISFVKSSETSSSDAMNVDTKNDENNNDMSDIFHSS
jgi:hypothetical protein